jgi:hypothetical protein
MNIKNNRKNKDTNRQKNKYIKEEYEI